MGKQVEPKGQGPLPSRVLAFKRGQQLAADCPFIVLDRSGKDLPRSDIARPLSEAGSSALVYRVRDSVTGMERAVKILDPEAKLKAAVPWAELFKVIQREARTLASLTHSHLAKLITFGVAQIGSPAGAGRRPGTRDERPYLVMEYIEGIPIHEFIPEKLLARPNGAPEVLVALLGDVLSALTYMHQRMAAHCDVKEGNILIRASDRPEAVLVDVGVAHIQLDGDHADRTVFSSTEGRQAQAWEPRVGNLVRRAEIIAERVSIDLHMFGVMLLMLVDSHVPEGKKRYPWQPKTAKAIHAAIADLGITILKTVAEKCRAGHYATADEVRRDLQAILPGYVSPFGVPELSLGSEAKTSIAMPDGRVVITGRVSRVVNHPTLQRLGEIRQLDFVRHIYPGATHTRLLHALDTYNVARSYVGALLGNPVFRAYSDKESLEGVLLAALLHDVGHYPLEHVFEDLAHKRDSAASGSPFAAVLADDDVAAAMLKGEDVPKDDANFVALAEKASIALARRALRDRGLGTLSATIEREFGEKACARMRQIMFDRNSADVGTSILRSIISSPIDADKVAYLRCDSQMTGVSFGRGLDVDSLLASLTCMIRVPETVSGPSIGVRAKGVASAEGIAEARRWLYQRVYWHHTNRAIMAMLRYPIQEALMQRRMTFEAYLASTFTMTDTEAVKWVDACYLRGRRRAVENPAKAIVGGRRGIYKRLLQLPERAPDQWQKARSYLMERPCTEWLVVGAELADVVRRWVPEAKDSDVLLDIPVKDRYRLGEIPVEAEDGSIVPLSSMSPVFASTKQFFREAALICRVYVHPLVLRRILEQKKRTEIQEAMIGALTR